MNGRYLRLLGAPRVESGTRDMPRFRSQRTVALLGYLATERRPVARDFLSALFWPDEPATTARANLRRELHNLSRILPDCWETDRLAVQFAPNANTAVDLVDFQRFEQSGQWVAAAALVRGHFLEGLALDDNAEVESWLLSERERWRERAERVMTRVIHTHTQQADFNAALEMAHQLLQLAPGMKRPTAT